VNFCVCAFRCTYMHTGIHAHSYMNIYIHIFILRTVGGLHRALKFRDIGEIFQMYMYAYVLTQGGRVQVICISTETEGNGDVEIDSKTC